MKLYSEQRTVVFYGTNSNKQRDIKINNQNGCKAGNLLIDLLNHFYLVGYFCTFIELLFTVLAQHFTV